MKTVCVTGAAGFIGSHIVHALLAKDYRVHATVRDADAADNVQHLKDIAKALNAESRLILFSADLQNEEDFILPTQGCDFVCHVASVTKLVADDPQKDIVDVAVNGTLNVLRAAAKSGTVKRVVVTSSASSIDSPHHPDGYTFSENDWSDVNIVEDAYAVSKREAERVALKFQAELPTEKQFDLVAICPTFVAGPVLHKRHLSTTPHLIAQLLSGEMPILINFQFNYIDVRDVAKAHIAALEHPSPKSRYLCSHQMYNMQTIATILANAYPDRRIAKRKLPNFIVPLLAYLQPGVTAFFLKFHLRPFHYNNEQLTKDFNVQFTPIEKTMRDSAESIIALGLDKKASKP